MTATTKPTRLTLVVVCLVVGVSLFPLSTSAAHEGFFVISKPLRQQWISEAIAFLQKQKQPEQFAQAIEFYESNRREDAVLAYRIQGQGFVRFGENEWLCLITHSGHDHAEIGDVVLAMDQNGDAYEVDTHVCGNAAFFLGYNMTAPTNNAEFFSMFTGDKRDAVWRKIDLPVPVASDVE